VPLTDNVTDFATDIAVFGVVAVGKIDALPCRIIEIGALRAVHVGSDELPARIERRDQTPGCATRGGLRMDGRLRAAGQTFCSNPTRRDGNE